MVATTAEIERLLDALEAAMLEGDQAAVAPISERFWAHRCQVPATLVERLIGGRARTPAWPSSCWGLCRAHRG